MKPDYMKYDGRTEEPPYSTEGDEGSASELNDLLCANKRAGFHLRQYAKLRQEISGKWGGELQALIDLANEIEST